MEDAVKFEKVEKHFGSVHALRGVSFACKSGDVIAIAGENGAGKSTLVKILSGVISSSSYDGSIRVFGRQASFKNVRDAERSGVVLVPQELNVVPEMTVADFMFLNRAAQRFGIINRKLLLSEAVQWLSVFRLKISPLVHMGSLGPHEQQLVSIARAMTQGVRILILDEPTASLTGRETDLLFERVQGLRTQGVTTLYISHRLAEFERVADAVVVMRDGEVVDEFRCAGDIKIPARVVRSMVGRDLEELYPRGSSSIGKEVLKLENWSVSSKEAGHRPSVARVNLSLHAGEIVGIFGLIGSGASELARSMFGASGGRVNGSATVNGRLAELNSPRHAMRAGLAYLPADRKRDGLILNMSISQNLTLAALGRFENFGMVSRQRELKRARSIVAELRVRCASIEQSIGDLSGGNQQKIAVAKWAFVDPQVVILEEPTRGVDVGARIEIYKLINAMAAEGKAVLLVSTDLPEVIGMSDRVLAMHDGRLVGSWGRGGATERDVMLCAAGSSLEYAA